MQAKATERSRSTLEDKGRFFYHHLGLRAPSKEPLVMSVRVPRYRRLRVVAFLGCRCLHRHGATLLTANLYIADMCAFGVINQA